MNRIVACNMSHHNIYCSHSIIIINYNTGYTGRPDRELSKNLN